MRLPGITVRPLVDMTGEHHFNEVFFEQVRVPKRWLIGERTAAGFRSPRSSTTSAPAWSDS